MVFGLSCVFNNHLIEFDKLILSEAVSIASCDGEKEFLGEKVRDFYSKDPFRKYIPGGDNQFFLQDLYFLQNISLHTPLKFSGAYLLKTSLLTAKVAAQCFFTLSSTLLRTPGLFNERGRERIIQAWEDLGNNLFRLFVSLTGVAAVVISFPVGLISPTAAKSIIVCSAKANLLSSENKLFGEKSGLSGKETLAESC